MGRPKKIKITGPKVKCSYTEMQSIETLVENPKNPNKHPEKQIELLAKIMRFQGWRSPIVVSKRSGFIIKGHARLSAAKLNKDETVPVDVQDYKSEAQEYADMVADNKIQELSEMDTEMIDISALDILGEDFDTELLGIENMEIISSDSDEPDPDDEVIETKTPISKLGDLYELGDHRLLCGDATKDIDALLDCTRIDMVYTDPPYGMKLKAQYSQESRLGKGIYNGKDMSRSKGVDYRNVEGDHNDWTPGLINTVFTEFGYCKEIFLWGADYYSEILPNRNEGSWIVWDKVTKSDGEVSGISKFHGSNFELCWSKSKHKRDLARIMHKGLGSVENDKRVHPTQKPVKLAEWFFDNYGKKVKTIADVYGGSGSTLIACEKTKRKCYMMEIDPHYIDVIVNRWCKFTGETKIKRNGKSFEWSIQE